MKLISRTFKILSFIIVAIAGYAAWILITTPNAAAIRSCIVTKKYSVSLCEKNKNYVRLGNVSSYLKNLILIAEDSNFYFHRGFDWGEVKNSFETNMNFFKLARGGSTITQQLAKNVFLPFDKNFSRKIREALITKDLEFLLTKNQIFEKYLNVIEMGPGIYGVSDASWKYFGKATSNLNLLEAAYLTYLIPNPKEHSKSFRNKKLTSYGHKRLLDLCYRMYRFRKITLDQYITARENLELFPWGGLPEMTIARLNGQALPEPVADAIIKFDTGDSLPELPPGEVPPAITGEDLEATE